MYEFYCNDVVDTMGTTTSTASPTPLVTGLGVDEEIPADLKAWAITAAEYRGHAIERKKSALKRGLITAGAVVGVGAVAVLTGGAALAAAGAALAAEGAVVGGVAITAEVARTLQAAAICGGANNQLTDPGLDDVLAARGVVYAPDFLVNADDGYT